MSGIAGIEEKLDTLIATIELAHAAGILGGTPMFSAIEVRKDIDPVLRAAWVMKHLLTVSNETVSAEKAMVLSGFFAAINASTEAQRVKKKMEEKMRWECSHCDWRGDTPIRGNQFDPGPFCPKCSEDVQRVKQDMEAK
jgi:Zn finger protein HypA/HybF involved in hydrogenase expression